ncbi:MAG: bifunctional demethylmenaquinone methyltransferase/2-methoxy-6-polyprenyl-1,4-benzoquinol methylase UbiE [Bacteroidales bacterium]|nr:bifunctional demethylmenaquinone methyltransferase/2-methoxy-6-polyprenyl-1,4-benzoquinol methylase UbiE [Bacteroidales bacterium]
MAYDFDKIAPTYDRLNHLMTLGLDRRWRRRAAKQLSASKPCSSFSVLDVACGTGDLSLELLRQGYQVTGIDLSEEMLEIAKRKTATASSKFIIQNSKFLIADAESLPFADASFDAVTCAFGIRNFVHLEKGLSEMTRVLKPGGVMVILEMSTPDSPLVRPFYNFYTKRIIPWLGQRVAGNSDAYTYLPSSIERFPKGKAMLATLSSQGLHATQKKHLFGVCRRYTASN